MDINFAKNLKELRKNQKLTQSELAEKIGYSEKAISKWENGNGLPNVETIAQLSKFFSTSFEGLLFGDSSDRYYLAIDGGGTKTHFLLADTDGNVIAETKKGPSNPNDIGIAAACKCLSEGIREVCFGYDMNTVSCFAGLSGISAGDNKKLITKSLSSFNFAALSLGSDVQSIIALSDEETDICLIMGTGFIAYTKNPDGTTTQLSGIGYLFEEGGSGYALGRDAIIAALKENDGTGDKTLISKLIQNKCGQDAKTHLGEFYKQGKRYIAQFAPLVFAAYQKGDAVAAEILDNNMKVVAQVINTGIKKLLPQNPKVMFAGSIARERETVFPLIGKYLDNPEVILEYCSTAPIYGALNIAKSI